MTIKVDTHTSPPRSRWPIFRSLSGTDKASLRRDVIAGLTVWAVLVPEALAYASIAGVSPVIGLYAAPPALLLYAAFGSSRHLVVGPMSATAALSAAAVTDLVTDPSDFLAFTSVLAIVTGLLALAAGLLRLGFLANFVSEPVLKGFIIGLALTIMIGQVPKLLGIEKTPGNFFEQAWGVLRHLDETHGRTLAVGLVSLAVVIVLRRVAPVVPGSLVAVVSGVLAVKLLDLDSKGVEIVGSIESGLAPLGLPDGVEWHDYLDAVAAAAGIMLVGFAEGLGAAKTYAARAHYPVDPNRELLGLGAANVASGLSTGMVVNGSLSKTAVNGAAGAKSQASGLVVAALTIVTLLLLTSLFEDLPEATLAAVVIAAVIELVDIDALVGFYRLYSTRIGKYFGAAARPDFIASLAALVGVLLFDTLPGLVLGIVTSLLLLLYRASEPHVAELGLVAGTAGQYTDIDRHPQNAVAAGVVVLRVEAALFFANAESVRGDILEAAGRDGIHTIVLDGEAISSVDMTALKMLEELAGDLERRHQRLMIAHDLGQVGDLLSAVRDSALSVYPTINDAIVASAKPDKR